MRCVFPRTHSWFKSGFGPLSMECGQKSGSCGYSPREVTEPLPDGRARIRAWTNLVDEGSRPVGLLSARLAASQAPAGRAICRTDIVWGHCPSEFCGGIHPAIKWSGEDWRGRVLCARSSRDRINRGVTYQHVRYRVRKSNFRPYKVEFYSLSNRLLKTCRY